MEVGSDEIVFSFEPRIKFFEQVQLQDCECFDEVRRQSEELILSSYLGKTSHNLLEQTLVLEHPKQIPLFQSCLVHRCCVKLLEIQFVPYSIASLRELNQKCFGQVLHLLGLRLECHLVELLDLLLKPGLLFSDDAFISDDDRH